MDSSNPWCRRSDVAISNNKKKPFQDQKAESQVDLWKDNLIVVNMSHALSLMLFLKDRLKCFGPFFELDCKKTSGSCACARRVLVLPVEVRTGPRPDGTKRAEPPPPPPPHHDASCRGKLSLTRTRTNRSCASAGSVLGEAAVAPGTHPPGGRKPGGGGRSRAWGSLTPPWTRNLTFRRLPMTRARRCARRPCASTCSERFCVRRGQKNKSQGS